jgi:hypothetical protein
MRAKDPSAIHDQAVKQQASADNETETYGDSHSEVHGSKDPSPIKGEKGHGSQKCPPCASVVI